MKGIQNIALLLVVFAGLSLIAINAKAQNSKESISFLSAFTSLREQFAPRWMLPQQF